MKKLRVGVIYGGRSGEHEVSLASAASVFSHLDPSTYESVPIRIARDGQWRLAEAPPTSSSAAEVIARERASAFALRASTDRATMDGDTGQQGSGIRDEQGTGDPGPEHEGLNDQRLEDQGPDDQSPEEGTEPRALVTRLGLDVVIPVLHGPYGEDGTVQGLLELADVPYVGSGVLASAVGMDKAVAKLVFAAHGLPVGDSLVVSRRRWLAAPEAVAAEIVERLSLPVFVKPANLGSSVGITKAKDRASLDDGLRVAAAFDRRIIVEAAIPDARDIEVAVLGNDEVEASVPGEIVSSREFYDYDAKYLAPSEEIIPAPLTPEQTDTIRRFAVEAFHAIDAAGLARVDFLLSRTSGALYVNEINTMPGFTTISMFAKLWAASGIAYPALLDRLIALALARHAEKHALHTSR